MNKREKFFLIITDLLLLALITYPIFQGGVVGGYDPGFHMGRIHTLANNISSGHFPNPIGLEYLNNFGYGVGFFYGNFFLYPFAILMTLGMTSYHAYLLYLITFIILNILSINFVTYKLFNKPWATILSGPLYLSSYYFISIIYYRAAAGELIALALIPWIFLSTFKLTQGEHKYWVMFGISFSLLLATHILSFLITVGAVILIVLMNLLPIFKSKKTLLSFIKGTLLFVGLSAVFLLPFIEQYSVQKYVDTSRNSNGVYMIIGLASRASNVIFDPTLYITINGTLLTTLLVIALVYYLIKGRGFRFENKLIPQAFIVIILYSSLILSYDLLNLAVHTLKPITLIQTITRLNVVILPLAILLIANALGELIPHLGKIKLPVVAIFFASIAVITIAFPIKKNMDIVDQRKGPIADYSVSMGEYEPRNYMNFNLKNNFQLDANYLEKTEHIKITTNNHQKAVIKVSNNKTARTLMLPRLYYKGYQVKLTTNGKSVTRPAQVKNGVVAVDLPANFKSGTIEVSYHLTTLNKIGWVLNILTLLLLVWLLFKHTIKPKKEINTAAVKAAA